MELYDSKIYVEEHGQRLHYLPLHSHTVSTTSDESDTWQQCGAVKLLTVGVSGNQAHYIHKVLVISLLLSPFYCCISKGELMVCRESCLLKFEAFKFWTKKILLDRRYDKPLSIHSSIYDSSELFSSDVSYGIYANILHLTFSFADF